MSKRELQKMLDTKSATIAFYWGQDEKLWKWLGEKDLAKIPIVDYDIKENIVWIKGYKYPITLSECTIGVPLKEMLKSDSE